MWFIHVNNNGNLQVLGELKRVAQMNVANIN